MKTNCPNKSNPDFKKLVEEFGELDATYAYFLNDEDIPSVDVAGKLLGKSIDIKKFDKQLAEKIQVKLEKLYPEIKLNITNTPVWEEGNSVFNQIIENDMGEDYWKELYSSRQLSNRDEFISVEIPTIQNKYKPDYEHVFHGTNYYYIDENDNLVLNPSLNFNNKTQSIALTQVPVVAQDYMLRKRGNVIIKINNDALPSNYTVESAEEIAINQDKPFIVRKGMFEVIKVETLSEKMKIKYANEVENIVEELKNQSKSDLMLLDSVYSKRIASDNFDEIEAYENESWRERAPEWYVSDERLNKRAADKVRSDLKNKIDSDWIAKTLSAFLIEKIQNTGKLLSNIEEELENISTYGSQNSPHHSNLWQELLKEVNLGIDENYEMSQSTDEERSIGRKNLINEIEKLVNDSEKSAIEFYNSEEQVEMRREIEKRDEDNRKKFSEILPKSIWEDDLPFQKRDGKTLGQANIKAGTVLVDALNQQQDTLGHEYAHHYIAWFRNAPIVQEAIKKWGSEEALVQSIGEQVVKQKGEAFDWWNSFVKWIFNKFNSLSKLEKQELTQLLTDAFLTRQDLNSIVRLKISSSFSSPRLKPLESILADIGSISGITSTPANKFITGGLINEQYALNNEVSIAELAPLFYNKIMSVSVNAKKLMGLVSDEFSTLNYEDKIDYLSNTQSPLLKEFLTNEAIKILNAQGKNVDEFTHLSELIGKHNDIQYYETQETIEDEPFYSSSKVDTGNIPYNDQSDAQKKVSKKMIDVAKIITGNTVTISTQELLDKARSKKDRKFLEEVTKGSKTVTVYERTLDEKTGSTVVSRRVSMEQKFISNRNKTASEIELQEEKSAVYRNTGTALHKMKEDAVKNLFSLLDVNAAFDKTIAAKSGKLDVDNVTEAELDRMLGPLMAQIKKDKAWKQEIAKVLAADVFANKYSFRKDGKVKQVVQTADKQHDAQYEKIVRSLLRNYLSIYKLQRKKDIETAKSSGKSIIINKPNIITERIVFDELKDEAGTMDFVAIFSDGDAAIIDYKFIKTGKFKTVIDEETGEPTSILDVEDALENFFRSKERSYNMQLSRYSEILTKLYGVKRIVQVRIKPTYISYTRNTETGEIDDNSKIADIFTSDESIGMMPIREEKTGNEALDKFLDAIINQSDKLIGELDKRKTWNTDYDTVARVNELKKIIVSIQVKGDLSLYTQYVRDFVRSSTNAIQNDLEAFDMAKINALNDELEFIKYFLNNTSSIMKEFAISFPKEYENFNNGLGNILTDINVLTETVSGLSVMRLREQSVKLGMDSNVFDSYKSAADISGIQSYLMGMKSINHPLMQVFSRNVERLNSERIYMQSKLVDDLKVKTEALDKWAASRGLSGTNKFKIMLNDQKNLLTEYGQEYYELRRQHDDVSNEKNEKWWRDNFEMSTEIGLNGKSDVTSFEEAKKRYFENVEAAFANVENRDYAFAMVNSRKEKWLIKNDYNHPKFDGYANCRFISPKNKERFYSDKYKELLKAENKPARDYYEFLIKKNYEFREQIGYDFEINRNMVPNIHKSLLDTVSQDGANMGSVFKNYWNSIANEFKNKEDGKIGSDKKEIPILFTDSINFDDKSIDLGKNLMMFATFINQYKHAKELKEVGNVIKRVLIDTGLAKQNYRGVKVQSATNSSQFESQSAEGSNLIKALDDYFNYYVYGETTKKDAITETIGETGVRLIGKIQKLTGRSAMAFNFLSAMAGSVNARSQTKSFAAAGKYFTEKQVTAANLAVTKFDAKLAFLDAYFQTGTQGTTDAKASALSANKLVRSLSEDPAYIFQRWFDKADEKVILHAMLSNFGIDPNTGNIERLDKLKRNYPSIEFKSILESVEEKELPDGTKNFDIINQHTGKPIEPDYSSKETDLLNVNINTFTSVRRKVDEMISRIKGAMSDENIATYRLSLLGRALGQYRNWIPTTFGERLKKEAYNMTMDEYEIGRWRVAGRIALTGWSNASSTYLRMLIPFMNKDFNSLGENPKMRELYDLFIANNPELKDKVSYTDYVEEHVGKLRSLAREIQMFGAFFISLLLFKWMIDDDDEKFFLYAAIINSLERVNMELGFYLPVLGTPGWDEFMKLLTKDPLPIMGAFNNVTGLIGNTIGETIDTLAGVESGKTIAPKMSGTDWDFSFSERKDNQGKLHYISNYLGLSNVAKYTGLRDTNSTKDSVWDYVFGESGETNKQ